MTNCENNCHYNGLCIDGKCDCFYGWDRASNCSKIEERIYTRLYRSKLKILIRLLLNGNIWYRF